MKAMETQLITDIEQEMLAHIDNRQMEQLHEVLSHYLRGLMPASADPYAESSNATILSSFIAAKRVEGCSGKSLCYYESTLNNTLAAIDKPVKHVTTDDLRQYLDKYQRVGGAGKVTIDNIRRILSSFFSWLEEENMILKSPVRRIHKVKTGTTVKETYTDEALELMRDHCGAVRDLAMIDLLVSTGMRVGELVNLDRADIDFNNRECVVFGKGGKERKVYFDARTKIHLQNYLDGRTDENPALFVNLQRPYGRLQISGVEIRLRELGRKLNMPRVHPHKFRRTLATMAIDKGMPIEQVQQLLGHQNVDTTLRYAMVNQNNVKNSHRKFIA
jgi:site-specific recombinase XerD